MDPFELISFESDLDLANTVAAECLVACAGNPPGRPFSLGLSGGRIAQRFFSAFTEQARGRTDDLMFVQFFWADERCVPPTDPESNFGIAHRLLFVPLAIPSERIHRIQGELTPEKAASCASEEILRIVPDRIEDQPVLDLVLLGMGEDGHVASLFPTDDPNPKMIDDQAVYRPVTAPKPPPKRITLGYSVLRVARQVWVLASGPGKEHSLKAALQLDGKVPLGRVLGTRAATRIFSDVKIA